MRILPRHGLREIKPSSLLPLCNEYRMKADAILRGARWAREFKFPDAEDHSMLESFNKRHAQ